MAQVGVELNYLIWQAYWHKGITIARNLERNSELVSVHLDLTKQENSISGMEERKFNYFANISREKPCMDICIVRALTK